MTHTLKIKEEYLIEIFLKNKTFELRKNDRDFKVGDTINFVLAKPYVIPWPKICEFAIKEFENFIKTNSFEITYVLKNCPQYGLDKNYCIISIEEEK